MNNELKQITFSRQLANHSYVGIAITLFYIWLGPKLITSGLPGLSVLLLAEIVILLPLVSIHLIWISNQQRLSFKAIIPFQKKLPLKYFLLWTLAGIVASVIIYVPLYPVGIHLRETLFSWLPGWYFNPSSGTDNVELLANVFLFAIIIDGFIGPVAEELFFRGYLLPRMAYLKNWAPVVNGCLFGLYHFWQPHNLFALMGLGIIFSFIVWKTKNVYVGIAVHCFLNLTGAVGGYLAALSGTIITR
jgi:membrane protease YdiL (CAAX protease family)